MQIAMNAMTAVTSSISYPDNLLQGLTSNGGANAASRLSAAC